VKLALDEGADGFPISNASFWNENVLPVGAYRVLQIVIGIYIDIGWSIVVGITGVGDNFNDDFFVNIAYDELAEFRKELVNVLQGVQRN
jgi:hypothetical protein